MSLESLYADSIEAGIQRQLQSPRANSGSDFRTWAALSAGLKGVPSGALEVGASLSEFSAAGTRASAARPMPKVLQDSPFAADLEIRRQADARMETAAGPVMRAKAAEFMPDPTTSTSADQVLAGLGRIGTKAALAVTAAGPIGGGVLLGAEETNTQYRALIAKGIDPETALKVAGVQGITAGASVAVPMVGPTVAKTLGLMAATGPGSYMAQEALSKQILEKAGYHDEASLHNPTDPAGLALATILPAVAGGVHIAGLARKPAPTLADVVLGNESGGQRYGADGKLLTSPKGAQGEMQVMPGTATDPGFGVIPARDNSPDELARVGREYLDAMQHRYGSADLAMAAYNAGPGAVDKALNAHGADWLAHLPDETQKYVAKGMKKLGDQTVEHAASNPETVDAARTRTTADALNRSMPVHPDALPDVARASDSIAAGEMPQVRPLTDYSDFFTDMEPKFEVPPESQATMRMDANGMPEIKTASIRLTDATPTARMEHVGEPGDNLTRFAVRDADGKVVGHTDLLLRDGKVVSLYDVETTAGLRGQGIGAKVVEAVTSLNPDRKIEISNIVDDAVPFWEKVGAQVSDGNRSPTLDWHQFAESPAGRSRGAPRRSEGVAGNAEAAHAQAAAGNGRAPLAGDARELSPEEAAQFGFPSAPRGENALPPPERVTLAAPKAVARAEPVQSPAAQRVAALTKESPDMPVQLPGSDKTVTLAQAMKEAEAEHAMEASFADMAKAAIECAMSFGA